MEVDKVVKKFWVPKGRRNMYSFLLQITMTFITVLIIYDLSRMSIKSATFTSENSQHFRQILGKNSK